MNNPKLDLALIGNCAAAALIDRNGAYVWACAPRFDGPPVFSALLGGKPISDPDLHGLWAVELQDCVRTEQRYERNTPILITTAHAKDGAILEIVDFAPRAVHHGRVLRRNAYFRMLRPVKGTPRVCIKLRPVSGWSGEPAERTLGSNHIRYITDGGVLRLTTNASVSSVADERVFRLEHDVALHLGPDEPFPAPVALDAQKLRSETAHYWQSWVRTLTLPLEWQEAVIRAAIALKLCAYEETGAIVAALTTSIPEAPHTARNWDYRYCWIRDAYYVVRALNRLGAADILENYLAYLRNLLDAANGGHVQPVYGVGFESVLTERTVGLPGYRGMGPVRVGNQAHEHLQHDVYGQIVLPLAQSFYDQRLFRRGDEADFEALEAIGERAFQLHDQPDAGLWEFRTRAAVHTYSSVQCWAACDRLAHAAAKLGKQDRAAYWRGRADQIHQAIDENAWSESSGHYAARFGGQGDIDASLLQLSELGYLSADNPRYRATVDAVERHLRRGGMMLRYAEEDDFGAPETAFNFCTFWFIEALHSVGRDAEARDLFEAMLAKRTHAGLLSEDITLDGSELWGNYPQTYSLVGLISCAAILSKPWSSVR